MTAAAGLKQRRRISAFLALTKPRIVELLLVTTLPTMIVAAGGMPPLWLIAATLVGGSLAAGGANTINMIFDQDIDRKMQRTKHRPLVTGEISTGEAAVFAAVLTVGACAWLWVFVNLLSAVLAVAAVLFYVVVYTLWLKRTSTRNIVIGGAAGAVPPLVGWAAVTGGLDWPPLVLFAVIFYWTPPHFWALAICCRSDYRSADVPMLPAVAGVRATARRILCYTLAVWVLTLVFGLVADVGIVYWAAVNGLGAAFVVFAVELLRRPDTKRAMRLFRFSITYMCLLFAAIAVDALIAAG